MSDVNGPQSKIEIWSNCIICEINLLKNDIHRFLTISIPNRQRVSDLQMKSVVYLKINVIDDERQRHPSMHWKNAIGINTVFIHGHYNSKYKYILDDWSFLQFLNVNIDFWWLSYTTIFNGEKCFVRKERVALRIRNQYINAYKYIWTLYGINVLKLWINRSEFTFLRISIFLKSVREGLIRMSCILQIAISKSQ